MHDLVFFSPGRGSGCSRSNLLYSTPSHFVLHFANGSFSDVDLFLEEGGWLAHHSVSPADVYFVCNFRFINVIFRLNNGLKWFMALLG